MSFEILQFKEDFKEDTRIKASKNEPSQDSHEFLACLVQFRRSDSHAGRGCVGSELISRCYGRKMFDGKTGSKRQSGGECQNDANCRHRPARSHQICRE